MELQLTQLMAWYMWPMSNSNTVSVINPATNTVVATIAVGDGPFGVAINPTNGLVYVTNVRSNTVSVVSTVS